MSSSRTWGTRGRRFRSNRTAGTNLTWVLKHVAIPRGASRVKVTATLGDLGSAWSLYSIKKISGGNYHVKRMQTSSAAMAQGADLGVAGAPAASVDQSMADFSVIPQRPRISGIGPDRPGAAAPGSVVNLYDLDAYYGGYGGYSAYGANGWSPAQGRRGTTVADAYGDWSIVYDASALPPDGYVDLVAAVDDPGAETAAPAL